MALEQPWVGRREWAGGRIPNFNRGSITGVAVMWGFALCWNLFVSLFVLAGRSSDDGLPPATLYAVLSPFILAGLFLLGVAISLTINLIRYRSLVLQLDTMPGTIGGKIAGTIHGDAKAMGNGMSVRLSCWRRPITSKGSTALVWEDVEDVDAAAMYRSPTGTTVPFRFDIPYECEPSDSDDGRIYWEVSVQTPRHSSAGTFGVPVYRTDESSPDVTERSLRPRNAARPAYSQLDLQRDPEGNVEIRFPRPTWVWKWYVFTVIVAAVSTLIALQQLPRLVAEGMPRLWVLGVYATIATVVLGLLMIIELGLILSPRDLRLGRGDLRVRYRSLFRGTKVVPLEEIADFVTAVSTGNRKHSVDVQRTNGITDSWLMMGMLEKREAEWVAHELRRALPARV